MSKIHPTALVDPTARIADDAVIGPYCIIEADTEIGPGCKLASNVIIRRYTSMGANNTLDSFCVLGGLPQDLKFDPASETYLRIGSGNQFREGVTISRGSKPGVSTTVGDN